MRKVRLGDLEFPRGFREMLDNILATRRVSYGPYSRKLEEELAKRHGVRFGVLSNSGTSSLLVALHALKLQNDWPDGAEVLVPATTFVATINAILQCGLKPVFVDVHPDYYDIDLNMDNAHRCVTRDTVAIVPVGLFGQTYDMNAVQEVALHYGLKTVFDFCEGVGVEHDGKPIGPYADVTCFSFYIAHIIQGGVGGIGITNDEKLASIMRSLVNHGRRPTYISIDDKAVSLTDRFTFDHPGYSFRITEFESALTLAEFYEMDKNIATRQHIASLYMDKLQPFTDFLKLPKQRPESGHCWMMFPLVITDPSIEKVRLCNFLEERGIETRDTLPILGQPVALKYYGLDSPDIEEQYPVSANMVKNAFYISSSNFLTEEDVDYVVRALFSWRVKS